MLFTTITFIFYYLPAVLFLYYILFRRIRFLQNIFLFVVSILFYAWGEPWFVLMMLLSILGNWFFALWIDKIKDQGIRRRIMITMLVMNFGLMFVFKYLNFTVFTLNKFFELTIPQTQIALPIGISFFTFQAVSYVLDVYRGQSPVQKKLFYFGLYVSFFPQLIAGPIVRYENIANAIEKRKESFADLNYGIKRFIVGLGKKVVFANNFAIIADAAFKSNSFGALDSSFGWLGIIAFTLQIYYDFSGYSDMAIGLGRMFGFHFLENFNFPYIAKSVTEFWRRWHISLSTWFRDYVYFPMGGSRVESGLRLVFNLFVVWSLTGLWHGANWTFITWGLMYFVLIALEKTSGFAEKLGVFGHLYTMAFVMIGWIIFKSESLTLAYRYLTTLFNFNEYNLTRFVLYLSEFRYLLFSGILVSINIPQNLLSKIRIKSFILKETITQLSYGILFFVCIIYIVKGSYNPFIYFNF